MDRRCHLAAAAEEANFARLDVNVYAFVLHSFYSLASTSNLGDVTLIADWLVNKVIICRPMSMFFFKVSATLSTG